MDDELKSRITGKGTNPVLIELIIGFADQMKNANINQKTTLKQPKNSQKTLLRNLMPSMILLLVSAKLPQFFTMLMTRKKIFAFLNIVLNMSLGGD
jgi:hypothetical protein